VQDVFEPQGSAGEALVGPLHTVTFATAAIGETRRFFSDGLGLAADDTTTLDARQCEWLGVPAGTRAERFSMPSVERDSQIRVLYVADTTTRIRPTVDGRHVGGLSIGFPMAGLAAREAVVEAAGFASSVGVKRIEFTSPDGVGYVSEEIHFIAPENVFALGVQRPDGFRPVGPLDESAGIGAPAYSAQCVAGADAVIPFYRDVLGYEIRRDVDLTVVEPSGLNLDDGMTERFIQAFAPGASTGYLVFLDHYDANVGPPLPDIGPPSRGVVMWSFPCRDVAAVRDRAIAFGADIIREDSDAQSPFLPGRASLLIRAPGGFPVEVFDA